MKLKGADISKHNGNVDFAKMKADGIQFVMLRTSFGWFNEDERIRENVKKCREAGIPYGFYHYSYADTDQNARTEAERFLALCRDLGGYTYPLALDMEDEDGWKAEHGVTDEQNLRTIQIFKDVIEGAGEYLSLYMSKSWFDRLRGQDKVLVDSLDRWLAHWGISEPSLDCGIWQYTNKGKSYGTNDRTDLNYCYKDYPAIIGAKKEDTEEPEKPSIPTYGYTTGNYEIICDSLNVRTGAGTDYPKKAFSELTQSAQDQGGYKKGIVFTAQEVKNLPGESWARTPSGWVCLQNQDGTYAKKYTAPAVPTYNYTTGNYKVICDSRLNVRTGPGKGYPIKSLSQLTASAQKQGGYKKGVVFTAKEVRNLPGESWARTPSGWVCLRNQDGTYCQKA